MTLLELNRHGRPVMSIAGTDWRDSTDVWDQQRLLLEFWGTAESYAIRHYGHLVHDEFMTWEDLHGFALDSLIEASGSWSAWCHERDMPESNKVMFAAYLHKKIGWDLIAWLKKHQPGKSNPLPEGDAIGYTQMRVPVRESMLHRTLVEYVASMDLRDQAALALYFFEQMGGHAAGTLLGTTFSQVSKTVKTATARILDYSFSQVLSHHVAQRPGWRRPFTFTPEMHDWTQANYGVDPETYLKFVNILYAADVSYLCDIIDNALGVTFKIKGQVSDKKLAHISAVGRSRRTITDEQIEQIMDLFNAGTNMVAISEQVGMSHSTVSRVTKGWRPAA